MPAWMKVSIVRQAAIALMAAMPAAIAAAQPPDMTKNKIVFFAPLPPLPPDSDLPFRDGAPDFDDLFRPGAKWDEAAGHIDVFAVPSTWVRHYSSQSQLVALIEGLRARGIALGMEVGPLPDFDACAKGEGFSGIYEIDLMRKIRDLGGSVDVIVFDEPFGFGHLLDAPGACQWSARKVARYLAEFVNMTREVFPDAVFGGNEPLWARPQASPEEVAAWVDAYAEATGEPLGFLHLDMEWSWPGWLDRAVAVRAALAGRGVRVGYIYNGGEIADQEGWIAAAAERAFLLESRSTVPPDDAVFQSWFDQPDRTLPDNDPSTFTGLVNRYFRPHSTIEIGGDAAGVVRSDKGAPIAGVPVRASLLPDAGATRTDRVSATVPANARKAVGIFRVNGEGAAAAADVDHSHRIGRLCRGRQEPRAEPRVQAKGSLGRIWRGLGAHRQERIGHAAAEGQKGSGASRRFRALQGDARRILCLRGGRERAGRAIGSGLRGSRVPRQGRGRARGPQSRTRVDRSAGGGHGGGRIVRVRPVCRPRIGPPEGHG